MVNCAREGRRANRQRVRRLPEAVGIHAVLRIQGSTRGGKGLPSFVTAPRGPSRRPSAPAASAAGNSAENHHETQGRLRTRVPFPQPTPVIMMLNVHYTRVSDLERPDNIVIAPSVPISGYRDGFGNWCTRMLAPAGRAAHLHRHRGQRHRACPTRRRGCGADRGRAAARRSARVPAASRYCDSDRLADLAWTLFCHTEPGWKRVQAICDFVHAAHRLRLPARAGEPDGVGRLRGAARACAATTRTWPSPSAAR